MTDFTVQGKGKVVTLYFSEDTNVDREEVKRSLSQALGIPANHIGHSWGTGGEIEFEWIPELNEGAVNGELQRLQAQFPTMRIRFGENSVITM